MAGQAAPAALAAFLAALVEAVEALTVVLAVGVTRGWRAALAGSVGAAVVLAVLVAVFGPALTLVPLAPLRILIGLLLLAFGWRWLAKAVRRAAGRLPLRDERANYARHTGELADGRGAGLDRVGVATAFKIVMLEGIEVVFIVVAVGAGGRLLLPASLGAAAAVLLVVLLGLAVHRPLARVPENSLKFAVAVLLCGFGAFWLGEGLGVAWPGAEWSLGALCAAVLAGSLIAVQSLKKPEGSKI